MGKAKEKIWVGVNGNEVFASSNLKGLSEDMGAVYSTVKERGSMSEKFTVAVGKMSDVRVWMVARVSLKRVGGRGGKRGKLAA